MSKFLVTGGSGFIGSHIVRRLLSDSHEVRVLDNLSTSSMDRLKDVQADIEFVEGDLRSSDDCRKACKGVEVIFHQAALPSVPRSVTEPALFHESNIDGTFQLLLAARDEQCRRLVYAGSSSAYGDQPELPKHEGMLPAPLSPYALNKLVGEYYCRVFSENYGLETLTLRYFNVFGPYQDPSSEYAAVIPAFMSCLLKGQRPTIYGDGEQTRDFTYIDNVVEGNMLAASAQGISGQVVNLACGERISLNAMIKHLNELLGTDLTPEYAAPRAGDVKHSCADISMAAELLGYQPIVDFKTGLLQTLNWYKDNL